eukprot:540114_1
MPYHLHNSYDESKSPISPESADDYFASLYRHKTLTRNQSVQTKKKFKTKSVQTLQTVDVWLHKRVTFDKDLNLLQRSIMPYQLYHLSDDETETNPTSPNNYFASVYRQETLRNQSVQTQQSVRRTLPNCQRHEVPYQIIEILTELNFIDEKTQEIP